MVRYEFNCWWYQFNWCDMDTCSGIQGTEWGKSSVLQGDTCAEPDTLVVTTCQCKQFENFSATLYSIRSVTCARRLLQMALRKQHTVSHGPRWGTLAAACIHRIDAS